MHELAIVEALLDQVERELERAGQRGRVVKLHLQIGRFSGVSLEAFRFAFELAALGTSFAGAQLEIDQPGAVCVCQSCGQKTEVEQIVLTCPQCQSPEIHLIGGQELLLQTIELEEETSRSEFL